MPVKNIKSSDHKRLAVRAAIPYNGKLYFLRESTSVDDQWLSLPGGKIEKGEDHLKALKRELFEELGLREGDYEIFQNPNIQVVGLDIVGLVTYNIIFRVCLADGMFDKHSLHQKGVLVGKGEIEKYVFSRTLGGKIDIFEKIYALADLKK